LQSPSAWEQHRIIHAYALEALGRGIVPNGTEGEVGMSLESLSKQRESKSLIRRFLKDFAILPSPPAMYISRKGPDFIDTPKSRRQLLVEERLEEEAREKHAERLAAESLLEKLESDMELQKQGVNRFTADDDEENLDRSSRKSNKRVKSRGFSKAFNANTNKFGSLIQGQGLVTLQSRVNVAVCGVPMPRLQEVGKPLYTIPPAPQKRGGLLTLQVSSEFVKAAGPPNLGPYLTEMNATEYFNPRETKSNKLSTKSSGKVKFESKSVWSLDSKEPAKDEVMQWSKSVSDFCERWDEDNLSQLEEQRQINDQASSFYAASSSVVRGRCLDIVMKLRKDVQG